MFYKLDVTLAVCGVKFSVWSGSFEILVNELVDLSAVPSGARRKLGGYNNCNWLNEVW